MQSNNRFLELRDVSLTSDDSFVKKSKALKNICLLFPHLGFFFVTGRNNSGKSILLSVLAGLNKSRKTIASLVLSGAGMNDLRLIFIIENAVLCLLSFLLSIPFIMLVSSYFNRMYFCQYFIFDFMDLLLLFISILCMSAVSLLIFVFRKKAKH